MTDEMCAFLSAWIRLPTASPPGENYADCARFLGAKLGGLRYQVEYVSAEDRSGHTDPQATLARAVAGASARSAGAPHSSPAPALTIRNT